MTRTQSDSRTLFPLPDGPVEVDVNSGGTQSRMDAKLAMCVLGSGSGGNSTVVRHDGQTMLIDAGFGPFAIARRLGQAKSTLSNIKAICVTHLDQDHFRPIWFKTVLGWGIKIYMHEWHQYQFARSEGGAELIDAGLVETFLRDPFEPLPGLQMSPIHLRHDKQGTVGYLGESKHGRFGYATDLGCVPDELISMFRGVDLLAIESNYDPIMQQASTRPANLKRRIMGGAGHLSNQHAFDAVQRIVRISPPSSVRHVVLLHRSRQCNTPEKVMEVFEVDPSIARRVALTQQRRRSRWFTLKPHAVPKRQRQLMLQF